MYNIKQKLLVTSLVCGSVILNSNFAMAQETEQVPTFQLQEMVVTATKTLKELKIISPKANEIKELYYKGA